MYTRSISPASHGNFYELYGIAAAVLGGCSLRGGEGSILGIVLGAVLLQMLQNLVNLLGIPSSLNFAVMGGVILIGVLADQQLVRYRRWPPPAATPRGWMRRRRAGRSSRGLELSGVVGAEAQNIAPAGFACDPTCSNRQTLAGRRTAPSDRIALDRRAAAGARA